ncbi:hypothetical protein GSI_11038 [Ganoderma sinense ZZ0214-1]|uniref:Uncharacterized protein n=1 Tax=Ganoderma sinense ZZ0214-1 TaxID=1077348 RepID=A0A2G8RZX5_9APHY|nr:hypothetical protein GSI_11038 [Ganoderma sinense ZZ0214-1]
MFGRAASIRPLVSQLKLGARPTRARPSFKFSTSPPRRAAGSNLTAPPPAYGPIGVARALQPGTTASPTIFTDEFSLADRVALVTGAERGIGLEMALALVEAGARAVYCVDLPKAPGEEWAKVREYVGALKGKTGVGEARLEYVCADVTDQEAMWKVGKTIGDREGRMDVGIAAAGILKPDSPCLTYPAKLFQQVQDVNVNGVLFTAQAAGQQMERFGNGGSIIMIASISGHGSNKGHEWVSYNTSKSAVLQMARSMACELGPQRIRVNTISPAYINTKMTGAFLAKNPEVGERWAALHPLGYIGRPDELRGAAVWLASDASSFCTGTDFSVNGGYLAW